MPVNNLSIGFYCPFHNGYSNFESRKGPIALFEGAGFANYEKV